MLFDKRDHRWVLGSIAAFFFAANAHSLTPPVNVVPTGVTAVVRDAPGTISDLYYSNSNDTLWVIFSFRMPGLPGLYRISGASGSNPVMTPFNMASDAEVQSQIRSVRKMVFTDANTIYAVTETGNAVKGSISGSSLTWNDQNDIMGGARVFALVKDNGVLYAATSNGIAKGILSAGNITWSWMIGTGSGTMLLSSPTSLVVGDGFLYAGDESGILKTSLSGPVNWMRMNPAGMPPQLVVYLTGTHQYLYAATMDSQLFSLSLSPPNAGEPAPSWVSMTSTVGTSPMIHSIAPVRHEMNLLGLTDGHDPLSVYDGNIGLFYADPALSSNYYYDFIRTGSCSAGAGDAEFLNVTGVVSDGDAKAFWALSNGWVCRADLSTFFSETYGDPPPIGSGGSGGGSGSSGAGGTGGNGDTSLRILSATVSPTSSTTDDPAMYVLSVSTNVASVCGYQVNGAGLYTTMGMAPATNQVREFNRTNIRSLVVMCSAPGLTNAFSAPIYFSSEGSGGSSGSSGSGGVSGGSGSSGRGGANPNLIDPMANQGGGCSCHLEGTSPSD